MCDPIVTHGPYLSALEIKGFRAYIKRYINSSVYFAFTAVNQSINQSIILASVAAATGTSGPLIMCLSNTTLHVHVHIIQSLL